MTPSHQFDKTDFNKHQPSLLIFDEVIKNIGLRGSVPEFPTGIEDLDNIIWGVWRKELLIIGARPSHGKTSLSLQIAWNLAKAGKKVVFNSLEMSKENIIERLTCLEFGINGFKLRKGFPEEVQKFRDCQDKMRARLLTVSFEVVDYTGRNINQSEEILKKFNPEIFVVDHAQKISSKGYASKYEALSDFVNRLQDFAITYNCAIILNSQINRGGNFLKGAGELEESADTLLFCNWICKEKPDHLDRQEYQIQVEKQRHGACDYTTINFDASCFKFSSRTLTDSEILMQRIK